MTSLRGAAMSAFLMAVNSAGWAQSLTDAQLPYMKAGQCQVQVNRPKDVNGLLYFDKNCTTAFVLPRPQAEMRLVGKVRSPLLNKHNCKRVAEVDKRLDGLKDKIERVSEVRTKLQEQLTNATTTGDSARVDTINKALKSLEDSAKQYGDDKKAFLADFEAPGYVMQLTLATNVGDDIQAYADANKNLNPNLPDAEDGSSAPGKLRFEAAPVQNAIIAFADLSKKDNDIKLVSQAVLPGITVGGKDTFNVESRLIRGNEAASGALELTLAGACGLFATGDEGFDMTKNIEAGDVSPFFVSDMTYEVPVNSDWGYTASVDLDPKDLFAKLTQTITNVNPRERHQSAVATISGEIRSHVEFKWETDGSTSAVNEARTEAEQQEAASGENKLVGSLYWDVKEAEMGAMEEKVLNQLEFLGMIVRKDPSTLGAKDLGMVDQVLHRVIRICSSRSALGFKISGSCHDEDQAYVVRTGSKSDSSEQFDYGVKIHFDHKVGASETLPILHMETFLPKKEISHVTF